MVRCAIVDRRRNGRPIRGLYGVLNFSHGLILTKRLCSANLTNTAPNCADDRHPRRERDWLRQRLRCRDLCYEEGIDIFGARCDYERRASGAATQHWSCAAARPAGTNRAARGAQAQGVDLPRTTFVGAAVRAASLAAPEPGHAP
jgi:hypothetical protein